MKVLVCGGRDYEDFCFLDDKLTEIAQGPERLEMIIQGGAKGADSLAWDWAYMNNIPCLRVPALWKKYGKSAGYYRNKLMLELITPDVVVAFPGGVGTQMMIELATRAGIKVIDYGRSTEQNQKKSTEKA